MFGERILYVRASIIYVKLEKVGKTMVRKIETVSLIGLGAIGAAYGSKLHDSLNDSLQVVTNEQRIQKYKNKGIKVNGRDYHFNYITPETKTLLLI